MKESIIIISVFVALLFTASHIWSLILYPRNNFVLKSEVVKAFMEVNRNSYSFKIGDGWAEDNRGNRNFIAAIEVEKLVDRINKVLEDGGAPTAVPKTNHETTLSKGSVNNLEGAK